MKFLILFLLMSFGLDAGAATVAVVDSGTDFDHKALANQKWANPREVAANRVDDDLNGKVDDVVGWNFAENLNRVFFRQHVTSFNPVIFPLFEIIARKQMGTPQPGDKEYVDEHVTKLGEKQKEALMAHLNYYGQYAHGTHVSGIVVSQAPGARILAARVFPDDLPPEYPPSFLERSWGPLDFVYKLLAIVSNGIFDQVGLYLGESKADIANYSLGIPLKLIAEKVLAIKGKKNPAEHEVAAETQRIFKQFEVAGRKWIAGAPRTLFVLAAGNDGIDNDTYPAFPASIRADNSITVAASMATTALADFSNFGQRSVDIAAPGVAIQSSVPAVDTNKRLPMSGTSMAAPYIAGVAAHIKDLNPSLTPRQIRSLLMQTVDVKPWLKEKVVAGGVVNPKRAYVAAEKTRTLRLEQAIASAREVVTDQISTAPETSPALDNSTSPEIDELAARFVF